MHQQRLVLLVQFIPDRHWQNKTSSGGFGQRTGGGAVGGLVGGGSLRVNIGNLSIVITSFPSPSPLKERGSVSYKRGFAPSLTVLQDIRKGSY